MSSQNLSVRWKASGNQSQVLSDTSEDLICNFSVCSNDSIDEEWMAVIEPDVSTSPTLTNKIQQIDTSPSHASSDSCHLFPGIDAYFGMELKDMYEEREKTVSMMEVQKKMQKQQQQQKIFQLNKSSDIDCYDGIISRGINDGLNSSSNMNFGGTSCIVDNTVQVIPTVNRSIYIPTTATNTYTQRTGKKNCNYHLRPLIQADPMPISNSGMRSTSMTSDKHVDRQMDMYPVFENGRQSQIFHAPSQRYVTYSCPSLMPRSAGADCIRDVVNDSSRIDDTAEISCVSKMQQHTREELNNKTCCNKAKVMTVMGPATATTTTRLSPRGSAMPKRLMLEKMGQTSETCGVDTRKLQELNVSLQDLLCFPKLLTCLCEDKFGSRYIQKMCDDKSTSPKDLEQFVDEMIVPQGVYLCKNIFGNYIIQKLLEMTCERGDTGVESASNSKIWIETCIEKKKTCNHTNGTEFESLKTSNKHIQPLGIRIIESVFLGNIRELSMNQYSCRVIQRIITDDHYPLSLKILFLKEICSLNDPDDAELSMFFVDQFGNHVLQKIIEKVPNECLDWIVCLIKEKVFEFSVHVYGCRVVQRLLAFCNGIQRGAIVNELLDYVSQLCCDKYGNYVMQKIITIETNKNIQLSLVDKICRDLEKLICDKFASNVIEQCLRWLKGDPLRTIICRILYPQIQQTENTNKSNGAVICNKNEECLTARMVRHEYGNYVIQTMLDVGDVEYCRDLVSQVERSISRKEILKYSWGKQILGKMYGEYIL